MNWESAKKHCIDRNWQWSLELIKQAIDNGVSVIECGYPTSEASAEGPVIKLAHDQVGKRCISIKNIKS